MQLFYLMKDECLQYKQKIQNLEQDLMVYQKKINFSTTKTFEFSNKSEETNGNNLEIFDENTKKIFDLIKENKEIKFEIENLKEDNNELKLKFLEINKENEEKDKINVEINGKILHLLKENSDLKEIILDKKHEQPINGK